MHGLANVIVTSPCIQVDSRVEENIAGKNTLIEICQSHYNQTTDGLSDCEYNNLSVIKSLQSVYNLGARFGNLECIEDGLQFFCHAINFLSGDTNSLLALSEECVQIRDNQCAAEWRIVKSLFNISLPDCNSFNQSAVSDIQHLPCPNNFGVFCDFLCLPLCSDSPHKDGITAAYNIFSIALYLISIAGGIITLIVSVIKRKKMWVLKILCYWW